MGISLRRALAQKKDRELVLIHSNSQYPVWKAERGYKTEGGISSDLAKQAYDCMETLTVAAAVMKRRVETGGENSHRDLQNSNVSVSQKRIDREFGGWLRERRRV